MFEESREAEHCTITLKATYAETSSRADDASEGSTAVQKSQHCRNGSYSSGASRSTFGLDLESNNTDEDSVSAIAAGKNYSEDCDTEQVARVSIWKRLQNRKVWGVILAVVLFLLLGLICGTKIFESIIAAKSWFVENPLLSVPWYCFLFSAASAVFMPYGPFCISVGYIFGLGWGLPVQLSAIFVSSAFIYLVGRVLLKKRVTEYTNKSEFRLWRAIMDHMGKDWKEAAKINMLMCFIPMPYGTHAYFFSVSECSFWNFVWVFEIGMIGHTLLNLAVGDALAQSSDLSQKEGSPLQFIATIVGAIAMIASIWYGGIVTQRIMDTTYSEEKVMDKAGLLKNASLAQEILDMEETGEAAGDVSAKQSSSQQGAGGDAQVELVLTGGGGEEEMRRSSGSDDGCSAVDTVSGGSPLCAMRASIEKKQEMLEGGAGKGETMTAVRREVGGGPRPPASLQPVALEAEESASEGVSEKV